MTLTLVVGAELLLKLFFGRLRVGFGPRLLRRGISLFHTFPSVVPAERCLYPRRCLRPFLLVCLALVFLARLLLLP